MTVATGVSTEAPSAETMHRDDDGPIFSVPKNRKEARALELQRKLQEERAQDSGKEARLEELQRQRERAQQKKEEEDRNGGPKEDDCCDPLCDKCNKCCSVIEVCCCCCCGQSGMAS